MWKYVKIHQWLDNKKEDMVKYKKQCFDEVIIICNHIRILTKYISQISEPL